jgi:hypothetical protein
VIPDPAGINKRSFDFSRGVRVRGCFGPGSRRREMAAQTTPQLSSINRE